MASIAPRLSWQAGCQESGACQSAHADIPSSTCDSTYQAVVHLESESTAGGMPNPSRALRCCNSCRQLEQRAAQFGREVDEDLRLAALERRFAGELRVRLLTALAVPSPASLTPPPPPSCPHVSEALRYGAFGNAQDGPVLQAIAGTILHRTGPPVMRTTTERGQQRVYVRQQVSRKALLKRSQQYARFATVVRLLSNAVGPDASAGMAGGAVPISVAAASCPGSRRLGVQPASSLTPEQQLGLIAVNG